MPHFEDNAAFIWAIYIIGLATPALLGVYAARRAHLARQRLERLQAEIQK